MALMKQIEDRLSPFFERLRLPRKLRALAFFLTGLIILVTWHYTDFPFFALVYANNNIGPISQIDKTNTVTISNHVFHVFSIVSTSNFYLIPLTGSYLSSHPGVNSYVGVSGFFAFLGVLLVIVGVGLLVFSPVSRWRPVRGASRFLTQLPSWVFFALTFFLPGIFGANNLHSSEGMRLAVLAASGITNPSPGVLSQLSVQPFVGFYLLYVGTAIGTLVSLTGQVEGKAAYEQAYQDAPGDDSAFDGNYFNRFRQLTRVGSVLRLLLLLSKLGTLAAIVVYFL
jgi:hypothetical protein